MTHREKHKGATQGMMSEENEEQRDVEIHRSREELDGHVVGTRPQRDCGRKINGLRKWEFCGIHFAVDTEYPSPGSGSSWWSLMDLRIGWVWNQIG